MAEAAETGGRDSRDGRHAPWIDALVAFLRGRTGEPSRGAAVLLDGEVFAATRGLLVAFYAVLFFFAASGIYSWRRYLDSATLDPRWPVAWLTLVDPPVGIAWILGLHLTGALLAITLVRHRPVRILVFLTYLELLALKFSYGSIHHGDHLGLLLAFLLIFLPRGWTARPLPGRRVRVATLLVFSACQAFILMTYSLSGLWKLLGVFRQLLRGEVHALSPQGLPMQIAAKLLSNDSTTILGPWLIEHAWVSWPMMLATLYLQLFALWAAFRPSLHLPWGLGLILFHLFSHLAMGIGFAQNALWLALFLVLSPLRPHRPSLRQALRDLPLVGARLPL